MRVDLVTGAVPPKYTLEIARRFPPGVECRLLPSKGYADSLLGLAYRWIDHPAKVRTHRRPGSVLHLDSLTLGYLFAWSVPSPKVLTCLDIVPLLREFDDPSYRLPNGTVQSLEARLLVRGLHRADRLIAISEHVRGDLVRLGCQKSRVDVVRMGVDLQRYTVRDRSDCAAVRARYGIPNGKRLVLFVGTEHPRKNLPTLFRAFERLRNREDTILVKVGAPRMPQRMQLRDLASSLGLRERILFLDHVDEEELPHLYGTADVVVLPSLYEGFGLPPLEAMACGTPVAVSRETSLPEVVGDGGLYFDARDDASIADALSRILDDPSLRAEMIARGTARAAQFPWEHTVAGLVKTYEKVLEQAG